MSLDTINMNVFSNNSSRPGTKERSRNNKSLKELMQDRSLMNYEQLDRINLNKNNYINKNNNTDKNESVSKNMDSMTAIPTF